MKAYIDCEFNGYRGALISMAIVCEDGSEWYESVGCANPDPWVAEHVMPVIGKTSVGMADLQDSLQRFLARFDAVHIVADWPEDIAHFCETLITGPGTRIDTPPLTMEVRRDIDGNTSAIPHNALEDARAIARMARRGPDGCDPPIETMERALLDAGWDSCCAGGVLSGRSWRAPPGSPKHGDGAYRLTRDAWILLTRPS